MSENNLKYTKEIKSHNQSTVINIEVFENGSTSIMADGDSHPTTCEGVAALNSAIRIYEKNINAHHLEISNQQQPTLTALTALGFKRVKE